MKRAIASFLAIFMIMGLFTNAIADDTESEYVPSSGIASMTSYYSDRFYVSESSSRAVTFTLTPSLTISSPSANKVSVTAQAHTSIVVDKLGFSSLHVQRWNGSSWVNVVSWYNQYKTNTSFFLKSGSTSSATSGAYYRAVCTFYAEKDGESESVTVTTSYIKCK